MLEHLIPPAERDEALAGDLEEHYRAGRSDAWYRRQAAAAVGTAWAKYLGRRRSMLVFALLWSMLAPGWVVFVDRTENGSNVFGSLWRMDWPFSTLANFGVWIILNVAFVWAGILLFAAWQARFASRLERKRVRQALLLAPVVFLPAHFATFVVMNLVTFPGLVIDRRTLTILGEITDARRWAIIIRIPYLLTMVAAMWRIAPRLHLAAAESLATGGSWTGSTPYTQEAPSASRRFFVFVVAAGLMNALICGILLCRLPESHAPSLSSLLLRAAIYVALGAVAGSAGAWIYWNNPASPYRDAAPIDFRLFALASAAGWIWVPAAIVLYEQVTLLTALVAVIAAFALAAGLRQVPMDLAYAQPSFALGRYEEAELFADPFLRPRSEGSGMLIAFSIYAGGYSIATHSYLGASITLGLAAFLVGWRRTVQRSESRSHEIFRAAFRLAILAMPAVLITAWALMSGVSHRNRLMAEATAQALEGEKNGAEKAAAKSAAHGLGGYDSVILWPYPAKKQIVAPMPLQNGPLAPGTRQPLVVEFDGPYWYVQPPDQRPGPDAHHARGSPLGVRIEANNSVPIVMEARQRLASSIPLARCGEIDVEIENRDHNLGVIGMALILEDSSLPRQQIYAGRQRIYTGDPDQAPLETLRFKLPQQGQLRHFDGITLMLLPETEGVFRGPRIAVRDFRLYPR